MPGRLEKAMLLIAGAIVAQSAAFAQSVGGSVCVDTTAAPPIAYAYVGILSKSFEMAGQAITDAEGQFTVELDAPVTDGYLMVQPPPKENAEGLGIYSAQPRIFAYNGESPVDLRLPAVGCIVLRAYDPDGQLMRWQDFQARGTFGGQFMYLTSLADRALPAVPWPVFDQAARDKGQPRELGLPAMAVVPGHGYVPQVLFWEVPGYGRLLLRADNAGVGFTVDQAGAGCVIELNVELARTAVQQLAGTSPGDTISLEQRLRDIEAVAEPDARAKAADAVLAEALRQRDTLVVESARRAIPEVRMGNVVVRVTDRDGKPVIGATVRITQETSDFLFGVFEGSPYNAKAFAKARDAGFNLATVLLGWGWTDAPGGTVDRNAIEQTFGIRALDELGFAVKAHGVVWLQGYGILPDRTQGMNGDQLRDAMLAQESVLLNAFGNEIAIWEAMNEPNATNVTATPRPVVHELLGASAGRIRVAERMSLVNGAHDGNYGRKYTVYNLDGAPADDWSMTYSAFLKEADFAGSTKEVDVIGLQYYPGFHFNESFGGLQGPATTPAWFLDLVNRYAEFGRPIHITEFSLPSSYGKDWTSGYWREPWTEETQADYAEMIFTVAFGHPGVRSISWWDIMDTKSSVIGGGLLKPDGSPKPIFERLSSLLQEWTRHSATAETNASGEVELTGFGGQYTVEVESPGGSTREDTVRILERESITLEISEGAPP
jgi:hypothetical protein